jgi:hypothetical protein
VRSDLSVCLQLLSESITARKLVYKISFCLPVLKDSDRYYLFKKRRMKYMEKLNSSLEIIVEGGRYNKGP